MSFVCFLSNVFMVLNRVGWHRVFQGCPKIHVEICLSGMGRLDFTIRQKGKIGICLQVHKYDHPIPGQCLFGHSAHGDEHNASKPVQKRIRIVTSRILRCFRTNVDLLSEEHWKSTTQNGVSTAWVFLTATHSRCSHEPKLSRNS